MQLIQINQKDLVCKKTPKTIRKDIVQRDQAFTLKDKRQRDGKRTSSTRQD